MDIDIDTDIDIDMDIDIDIDMDIDIDIDMYMETSICRYRYKLPNTKDSTGTPKKLFQRLGTTVCLLVIKLQEGIVDNLCLGLGFRV